MKKLVAEATFTKVKGEGLKFSYLPVDQMKPIVEDAMNKSGLYLSRGPLEYEEARESWTVASSYGPGSSTWFHYKGRRTFQWINVDNPSDRSEPQTYDGEAKDNSDKTLNKLSTAILKAFYKEEFNISESPKDDTDNTEDEVKAEKAQQKKVPQKADPFFSAPKKEDIPAPKKPEPTDITTDRPREEMVRTIVKAYSSVALRPAVKKAIQSVKASESDTDDWTDEQVREIYKATVKAGRDAE